MMRKQLKQSTAAKPGDILRRIDAETETIIEQGRKNPSWPPCFPSAQSSEPRHSQEGGRLAAAPLQIIGSC